MKVKIFEESYYSELEDKINGFLKNIGNLDIVDIKYTGTGSSPTYSSEKYSAMVIFKG